MQTFLFDAAASSRHERRDPDQVPAALEARPPARLGIPVAADDLVRSALESSIQGEGHDRIEELVSEPYVGRDADGYFLRNDPGSQALAAVRLHETCGYSTLQIEATLSRFQQAGGFDAYEESKLRRRLSEWR